MAKCLYFKGFYVLGANEQIRTADLYITNVMRYLLRHVSILNWLHNFGTYLVFFQSFLGAKISLPRRCTTDCATLAYSVFELNFVDFRVIKFAIFYLTKAVHYRLCYISIFSFRVKFCCFFKW